MNLNKINPGAVACLCAVSLTILFPRGYAHGIFVPVITVTPPSKSTPSVAPTPAPKTPAPLKAAPATITPTSTPKPSSQPTTPSSPPLVIVTPLTPAIVKNFTNLYGQVLGVKFAPDRQQQISARLNKEWMTNLGLRNTVAQTIALEAQITNGTPTERTQLQTTLVANLRQQVLDGDTDALWLVSFYDASPKNWLAPGKPPLTRMSAEISADALCFMVNEIMGKSVVTPDLKLKNAIAAKLTTEYPKIAPDTKQTLSRLPANWLTFKNSDWFRRSDEFREQMRIHWGQNLEAYIPELKEMNKLRRDRLAKLKADPTVRWNSLNAIQRQGVLQKSDAAFQTSVRALAPVKTVVLNNYINTMQVANTIGNSPTRYSLKLKVK